MDIERIREYCLKKAGATEGFPFNSETLVFKVAGKMFALLPLETGNSITLKCAPNYATELREKYPESVKPGYHMNKKHWNTISLNGNLTEKLLLHLINHSYEKVVSKLNKGDREKLKQMYDDPLNVKE